MKQPTGAELFERLADRWALESAVTKSTMMGFPCLRSGGKFFASVDRAAGNLVVKLPAGRVAEAIAAGEGAAFAPNGRVFREWLAVPASRADRWEAYVRAAYAFVCEDVA
jgi:hypothetical protein